MGYMGTIVTQGRGLALTVATGMQTELGKIADLIQQSGPEETPLQKRLDALGKTLAVVGVLIAVLIGVLGLLRGDEIRHMLLTAVSVAVAIVPGRAACRRDDHPGPGRPAHARKADAHPQAARRGNPGLGDGDLLRQNRNADREPHDGCRSWMLPIMPST